MLAYSLFPSEDVASYAYNNERGTKKMLAYSLVPSEVVASYAYNMGITLLPVFSLNNPIRRFVLSPTFPLPII